MGNMVYVYILCVIVTMLIKCELLGVVDIELSVLTIFIFDSQIVVA